ncbi:MAG: hypothetical protein AB1758_12320, partial [Candidatus Eremiobacterota bacterium]
RAVQPRLWHPVRPSQPIPAGVRDTVELSPTPPIRAAAAGLDTSFQVAAGLLGGALGPTLEAARQAVQDELAYELRTTPEGSALLPRLEVPVRLAPGVPSGLELAEAVTGPAPEQPLRRAVERTAHYLNLTDEPLLRPVRLTPQAPPSDAAVTPGFSPEVLEVPVERTRWTRVDEYTESRLGPMAHVVDELGPRDRIRLSNLPAEQALAGLPGVAAATRMQLPISSWEKEIHLLGHPDGSRTLLVSGVPGRVMLRHLELLVRRRLCGRPDPPAASIQESSSGYRYDLLRDFFRCNEAALGRVDAVAVGYSRTFEQTLEPAARVEGTDWSAALYSLPDGRRLAVLKSGRSFHGEILGQFLRRLVDDRPDIRQVYVAGSGGSLHVRDPYEMVFPGEIRGPSGRLFPNSLGGHSRLIHESVLSPLVETPDFLESAQRRQVGTVDMELGHVAEALEGTGVAVGYGVLVTDFPAAPPSLPLADLTRQDSKRKYRHTSNWVDAVTRSAAAFDQPLERHLKRPLRELSRENLARTMRELGPLTPAETLLFQRLRKLTPNYSFRVSLKRLKRMLEDGVVLSTGQVARLHNREVTPYTPRVEDTMFGAFDYTFGALGFGAGDDRYGEVELRVKPEAWQRRSWATFASGWRALERTREEELPSASLTYDEANPELMRRARERFGTWVQTPEDYPDALAAGALRRLRKQPELMAEFMAAAPERLPELLSRHRIAYLEAKIPGSLNLSDLAGVRFRGSLPADVARLCRERGIPVEQEALPEAA